MSFSLFFWHQAAVGDHPVKDVCFSSTTKKLLLRLADSCDRWQSTVRFWIVLRWYVDKYFQTLLLFSNFAQIVQLCVEIQTNCCIVVSFRSVLTSLKVDPASLIKSEKSGRVKGLIITLKGSLKQWLLWGLIGCWWHGMTWCEHIVGILVYLVSTIRISRMPARIRLLLQILCAMERHSWRSGHW